MVVADLDLRARWGSSVAMQCDARMLHTKAFAVTSGSGTSGLFLATICAASVVLTSPIRRWRSRVQSSFVSKEPVWFHCDVPIGVRTGVSDRAGRSLRSSTDA